MVAALSALCSVVEYAMRVVFSGYPYYLRCAQWLLHCVVPRGCLHCLLCAQWLSTLSALCSVVVYTICFVLSGCLHYMFCAQWLSTLYVLCSAVVYTICVELSGCLHSFRLCSVVVYTICFVLSGCLHYLFCAQRLYTLSALSSVVASTLSICAQWLSTLSALCSVVVYSICFVLSGRLHSFHLCSVVVSTCSIVLSCYPHSFRCAHWFPTLFLFCSVVAYILCVVLSGSLYYMRGCQRPHQWLPKLSVDTYCLFSRHPWKPTPCLRYIHWIPTLCDYVMFSGCLQFLSAWN